LFPDRPALSNIRPTLQEDIAEMAAAWREGRPMRNGIPVYTRLPDWRTIGLTAPRPSGVPDVGYVEYRMEWRDQFGVLRSDVWPKP
jgi:hypothetical protein